MISKDKCYELVTENKLEQLLSNHLIKGFFKKIGFDNIGQDLQSDIRDLEGLTILTLAQYNAFKRKELEGTISDSNLEIGMSKIRKSCIEIVGKIQPYIKYSTDSIAKEKEFTTSTKISSEYKEELFRKFIKVEDASLQILKKPIIGVVSFPPNDIDFRYVKIIDYLISSNRVEAIPKKASDYQLRGTNMVFRDVEQVDEKSLIHEINILLVHLHTEYMPDINYLNFLGAIGSWGLPPMVFATTFHHESMAERIIRLLDQKGFILEMNGGFYQYQGISLKDGDGIQDLVQKVALELELLIN